MQSIPRESGLRAYNRVQVEMMERFVARGGTPEQWCRRRAAAFRRHFAWMLSVSPEKPSSSVRRRSR